MFDINEYLVQKTEESTLFYGLAPRFHVIFHTIWFFPTNGDIKKNKVTTLQFSDCNFTIRIFITDSFREMDQKLAILKK